MQQRVSEKMQSGLHILLYYQRCHKSSDQMILHPQVDRVVAVEQGQIIHVFNKLLRCFVGVAIAEQQLSV